MGNNASSETRSSSAPLRAFNRTGALGLSRRELDDRCKPSGLYPACQWEDKAIRRLIGDGKLAPRLRGSDHRQSDGDYECPICFLQYSQINMTKCCSAHICTECYLQVRPQREKHCACPFCNHAKLHVVVAKQMNESQLQERAVDEQRVIEATIRARQDGSASPASSASGSEDAPVSPGAPATSGGFGSSVEQSPQARLLRARSESLSSADPDTLTEDHLLSALAMTADDRRALEQEMRAQHTHPLARRVEQEAEERRIENERNYIRRQNSQGGLMMGSRNRRMHRSTRNWNDIVEAFESGGNGEIQSLDDLVVLEAAILLSMEEEARRRGEGSSGGSSSTNFDASQHARDGFPLVERFLSSRSASTRGGGDNDNNDSAAVAAELSETLQGLVRRMSSGGRRFSLDRAMSTPQFGVGGGGAPSHLRGYSEAEQIEMAIALSLQESEAAAAAAAENSGQEEGATSEERASTPARISQSTSVPLQPSVIRSGMPVMPSLAFVGDRVHVPDEGGGTEPPVDRSLARSALSADEDTQDEDAAEDAGAAIATVGSEDSSGASSSGGSSSSSSSGSGASSGSSSSDSLNQDEDNEAVHDASVPEPPSNLEADGEHSSPSIQ